MVPIEYEREVINDYKEFKNYNLSIPSWAFWKAKNENLLHLRKAKLKIYNPKTKRSEISQIDFTIIDADYKFEIGLPIGLEKSTII